MRAFPRSTATIAAVLLGMCAIASPASAAVTEPPLGTAADYSVLAATTVTNTGPSVLAQNLGVSAGSAVTGFPPGLVRGSVHAFDAAAGQAQLDATAAATTFAGLTPTGTLDPITGTDTLTPGVYRASTTLLLTSALTLDGQGDPDAVFVIQVGTALTTAAASSVIGINGAQACHVYWQVGSAATLDTGSTLTGTVLAGTSVTMATGAALHGRALAQTAAVTLDSNLIDSPACLAAPPVVTTSPAPTVSATVSVPVPTVTATAIPIATSTAATSPAPPATATATRSTTGTGVPTGTPTATTTVIAVARSEPPADSLADTGTQPLTLPLTVAGLSVLLGAALMLFARRSRSRVN